MRCMDAGMTEVVAALVARPTVVIPALVLVAGIQPSEGARLAATWIPVTPTCAGQARTGMTVV